MKTFLKEAYQDLKREYLDQPGAVHFGVMWMAGLVATIVCLIGIKIVG